MKSNLIRTILLALLLMPTTAGAAVIWVTDSGGVLLGAQNVDVGGTLYDVSFIDGSCSDAHGTTCNSSTTFTFSTIAEAEAASEALMDQVFLDIGINGSPGNFDSQPFLTRGCTGSGDDCRAYTAFGANNSVSFNFTAFNSPNEGSDATGYAQLQLGQYYPDTTWAVWNATPVPLPAGFYLLASGLIGVAGMTRRRKSL